jgi:hypothetical protein
MIKDFRIIEKESCFGLTDSISRDPHYSDSNEPKATSLELERIFSDFH